jgi:acyl carrier protein phosphodiesterase
MNFLAHAYLSGSDENILVGNFIADHVKGKAVERYPEKIMVGIRLHRRIDAFTDLHPVFRKSTARLRESYGRYSGVIVDMFYDHFLARNWSNYSAVPIRQFTSGIYKVVMRHFLILPPKTRRILPFMAADDWLAGYAYLEGLNLALNGMSRRTNFNSGMEHAVEALKKDYDLYKAEFEEFFQDLRQDTMLFFEENGFLSDDRSRLNTNSS